MKRPKKVITIFIEGGVVHSWEAEGANDIRLDVIDMDIDGVEEERLCNCDKCSEIHIHHEGV